MECPFCGKIDTGVIDSRPTKEGGIRRRRKCLDCAGRFTTYEATTEQLLFLLMKRHAGKGASMKSSEAVLSFMSSALRGLSQDLEKLIGQVE
jgi:transcriptional regulator NrdR family protein